MDMTDFRSELHVAQQSRRDKLRVQQISPSSSVYKSEDFSNNWENSLVHHHPGSNPDLIQSRNVRNAGSLYDLAVVPSGLVGFSPYPISIPSHTEAVLAYQDYANMNANTPQPIQSSTVIASIKDGSDPQGGNWKSVDSSQQINCENWMVMNYKSDQACRVSNVGELLSNDVNVMRNNSVPVHIPCCGKPIYGADQDVTRSSMTTNPSSIEIFSQEDNRNSYTHLACQNSFQNLVTVACSGTRNSIGEVYQGSWSDNSQAEHVFLPSYGNQIDNHSWLNRSVGIDVNQCSGASDCNATLKRNQEPKNFMIGSAKQGLALSLSSNPSSRGCVSSSGIPKPPIINKSSGKSLHDVVGASPGNTIQRHVGPLGPFTGYATILKSSRFLKPAQEMLDEFCSVCSSKIKNQNEVSAEVMNAIEEDDGAKGNDDSGVLSSTRQSFDEIGESSSSKCCLPDNGEKKAKLLFLQEEVCRRYRLYHQQMQMVVSSFVSVAGLSSATPYISLALKRVARNFRCLKIAISDQLKNISRSFGDEFLSPSTSKSDGGNNNMSYNNNNINNKSFPKQKSCGGNVGFLEPQHHIWRPQRGLPERAVAILRAWLFDHFLHPYPTDTDKQMLATQTGLSRNQVSNWFINARVRVWKPMVEEIHMLETKGLAPTIQNSSMEHIASNVEKQETRNKQIMEWSGTGSMIDMETNREEFKDENGTNNQEKRSRVDYTSNVDPSSMMGLNQRNGFEIGIGNVSLTLGLRHGVETIQQQQRQLGRLEDRFGGGQMVHDFVG